MASISVLQFFVLLVSIVAVCATDNVSEVSDDADEGLTYDDTRLAGGTTTTIEQFPYQVAIRVANTTVCGGFILSNIWVMTAAHCVDGATVSAITIRAGSALLNSGGTLLTALSVEQHSLYNASKSFDYDFALIRLSGNLTFGTTIKAIALPTQGKAIPFLASVTLSGWGVISQSATAASNALKTVQVMIIPRKLCQFLYGLSSTITDRMFCAGKLLFGGRGACLNDAGGAVVYNNMAIGVISFGFTCGSPIFPSVFANIASVREWVKGVTGV